MKLHILVTCFLSAGLLAACSGGAGSNSAPQQLPSVASRTQALGFQTTVSSSNVVADITETWSSVGSCVGLSGGNLVATRNASNSPPSWCVAEGNVGVSTRKWYWEIHIDKAAGAGDDSVGFGTSTIDLYRFPGNDVAYGRQAWGYYANTGNKCHDCTAPGSPYGATWGAGDYIGVALDMTDGYATFSKNCTAQPQVFSGTFPASTLLYPVVGLYAENSQSTANFTGPFHCTVPSGYSALGAKPLFVVNNGNNTVTEYAPPYTGAPTATISNGVSAPYALAFDASGDLFVANDNSNTVTEYAPPYTGAPTATISNGVSTPFGLAFDASGDLFVANFHNNNVTEYAPPYTGAPTATISNSVIAPFAVAFDASGDLFVGNATNTVTEYAPPYTSAPTATISSGVSQPFGLAFDASGDLFVANDNNNNVKEYAPPYTGAPTATISNSVIAPFGVAFDASGDLFVANVYNFTVTEYAPPYTGAPTATISNGLNAPFGLAFGP